MHSPAILTNTKIIGQYHIVSSITIWGTDTTGHNYSWHTQFRTYNKAKAKYSDIREIDKDIQGYSEALTVAKELWQSIRPYQMLNIDITSMCTTITDNYTIAFHPTATVFTDDKLLGRQNPPYWSLYQKPEHQPDQKSNPQHEPFDIAMEMWYEMSPAIQYSNLQILTKDKEKASEHLNNRIDKLKAKIKDLCRRIEKASSKAEGYSHLIDQEREAYYEISELKALKRR